MKQRDAERLGDRDEVSLVRARSAAADVHAVEILAGVALAVGEPSACERHRSVSAGEHRVSGVGGTDADDLAGSVDEDAVDAVFGQHAPAVVA